MLQEDNQLITIGYDGLVNYVDMRTSNIIKTINLEHPLKHIVKH